MRSIFRVYVEIGFWFLLFHFAMRAMSFAEVHPFSDQVFLLYSDVFVQGLRFDVLIYSFWLLPLAFLELDYVFLRIFRRLLAKVYIIGSLLWMAVVHSMDLVVLRQQKIRMDWESFHHFDLSTMSLSSVTYLKLLLIVVFFFLLTQRALTLTAQLKVRFGGAWLVWLFVLALGARGRLGEHHLRREDCQVSSVSQLNEVCLNPIWNYTKSR